MRNMQALAWLLVVVSSVTSAQQTIWKCQDAKGAKTFQNAPCARGTREVGAKVYETPTDTTEAAERSVRIRQEMDQRNAQLHAPGYAVTAVLLADAPGHPEGAMSRRT